MNEPSHVIACVWDFDNTLIPGYMQVPMFKDYGIDEPTFWRTVNRLPAKLRSDGVRLADTLSYLNFVLTLVKKGRLPGLSKARLTQYGQQLEYCPGVPEIFPLLKSALDEDPFKAHGITLEHYVISSGHIETIRGSKVAPYMESVFASEFLEEELSREADLFCGLENNKEPENNRQMSLSDSTFGNQAVGEVKQIGYAVDTTQKTRCLFEINKGCNKNEAFDVNMVIEGNARRIPFQNMIYIADGPSDIPAFSVVRGHGGRAFAVYHADHEEEFEQCDRMLSSGRVDAYGPADYREDSATTRWLKMHIQKIAKRIIEEDIKFAEQSGKPPEHFH